MRKASELRVVGARRANERSIAYRESTDLPKRLRLAVGPIPDVEFDEDDFELDLGYFGSVLLLPLNLVCAIVSTLYDIAGLVPFTVRCFHALWRDLANAARFYRHHTALTLHRFLLGPIHFAVADPVGFTMHVVDRCYYFLWCAKVSFENLRDEFLEQIGDVRRLFQLLFVQAQEVLGLAELDPSPIHAVPLRKRGLLLQAAVASADHVPGRRNGRSRFVLMTKRDQTCAGEAAEDKREGRPNPVETIKFEPSLRTQLADPDAQPDPDELDDSARKSPVGLNRLNPLHAAAAFFHKCPNCASEEVYAAKRDGGFARSEADFALVVQPMFCERCITPFSRPGRLFLAPKPSIRPKDSEMYDG